LDVGKDCKYTRLEAKEIRDVDRKGKENDVNRVRLIHFWGQATKDNDKKKKRGRYIQNGKHPRWSSIANEACPSGEVKRRGVENNLN